MPDMRRRIALRRGRKPEMGSLSDDSGTLPLDPENPYDPMGMMTDIRVPETAEVEETEIEGSEAGDEDGDSEEQRLQNEHGEFREEFQIIVSAMREERKQCLQDRRFAYIAGGQWEQDGEQFKNRPKLEINKVAQALDQIRTDYDSNRIDVAFISKDGAFDESLADTCAAMHRADVQDSNGKSVHSNAFREMSAGGIGAWRLKTRYEDDEAAGDDEYEPQRIKLEAIHDADRFVFFDLDAREEDKSDARVCYIIQPLTHREYKRRYPDDDLATWPEEVHHNEFDWMTPDIVYLAERYSVEYAPDMKFYYEPVAAGLVPGGTEDSQDSEECYYKSDLEKRPDFEEDLLSRGYQKTREKKVKRRRIRKVLMNGARIIKDYGYIIGTEIPVVIVYGHRLLIDNIERVHGHVRRSRDPQRIKNMLLSKLAELSAVSSVKKPMFIPEQIARHKGVWADDSITNNPWLPVDPATNADGNKQPMGPVGWTEAVDVPPVTAELHKQADMDMKEILGNINEGEKVVSHVSGTAVKAIRRQVDKKSEPYINGMAAGMRRQGVIWLGMVPEVYNQKGRRVKGVGPRNDIRKIEIKKPVMDDTAVATGGLRITNDLSRAKFDVAVEVGPSSESQREAAMEAGIGMLGVTDDPELKRVAALHIYMNWQGEGSEYIRKWARTQLVQLNVVPPTPEEAQAMAAAAQNQQPSPIDQLALAQAQEALAKVEKLLADQKLVLAQVDKTQAETVKTLVDANVQPSQALVDAAKSLHEMAVQTAQAMQAPAPGDGSKPSGSS